MLCWQDFATAMHVCPLIVDFLQHWDTNLPNDRRERYVKPLLPQLVNTRGSQALEHRRAWMVMDWAIRTMIPAWLRPLAELEHMAVGLQSYPPITERRTTLETLLEQVAEATGALADTFDTRTSPSKMHLSLLSAGWGGAVFAAYRLNWDLALGDISRTVSNASICVHERDIDMRTTVEQLQSSASFLLLQLANAKE
jgi:hypothetical protein